jgi:hypothetical protein
MDDATFAQETLNRGLLSVAKLGEAKRLLERERWQGRRVSLPQFLIEKGYLSAAQVRAIQNRQTTAAAAMIDQEMMNAFQAAEANAKPRKDTMRRVLEELQAAEKASEPPPETYYAVPGLDPDPKN